ncbi:MAG: Swt1 family HEPN domain-containing protein [Clostridia bacterium]|nr:Swt1 family HEPN domain-containing protein [Clostridia bacterium]
MPEFSLIPPDNEKFFKGLLVKLKHDGEHDLVNLLKGAKCVFEDTGIWSHKYNNVGRFDANAALVYFFVPSNRLEFLDKQDVKKKVLKVSDSLVSDRGFDVKNVYIEIDIDLDNELDEDLIEDLNSEMKLLSKKIITTLVPEDLRIKGLYMAEVYTYLYTVENALRLFIEKVGKEKYGDNYFDRFVDIQASRNRVKQRKEKAEKNKWLSLRGENSLFYIDFDDLGAIIKKNWKLFETYFPSQPWIVTKIEEMSSCRNLIAHNSYISKSEKDLIKSYFNSILAQLDLKFEEEDKDFVF